MKKTVKGLRLTPGLVLALVLALILALGALPALASAARGIPEPNDDFWVLDDGGVLSDATLGEIFYNGQRLFDAAQTDLVVVVVSTTGNYDIDDYCNTLYNQWEIKASGVLVVLAIGDDKYFTLPGDEMSLKLDSATIKSLQDTYLEPQFAKKNYDAAVKAYYEQLYAKVCSLLGVNLDVKDGIADYEAYIREAEEEAGSSEDPVQRVDVNAPAGSAGTSAGQNHTGRNDSEGSSMGGVIFVVVVLIVILIAASSRSRRRRTYRNTYYGTTPPPPPPPRSNNSFATGFLLGNLMNRNNRRPPAGGGYGGTPPSGGYTSRPSSGGLFGGGSSSRSSGFGGASRSSSFGGSSRSFSSSSRSSSSRSTRSFGGASRSGGGRSGSRGGGAGRSARR